MGEFMEDGDGDNEYYINYNDKNVSKLIDLLQNKLTANDILNNLKNEAYIGKIKKYLERIWILNGVQNMYENRRNEILNLSDSISYFMNDLDRVLNKDYIPTINDILLVRKRTSGINKIKIDLDIDNLCIDENLLKNNNDIISTVTICDVGGAPMEQKKWRHHFVGVTAIIYIVGLSSFDEKSNYDDDEENKYKLKQQLNVFNKYINSNELKNKQWILFLNKIDLFAAKIKKGKSINVCFNDYIDDDHDNLNKSINYISKQFSLLNKTSNKLYTHVTCAIDKKFMKKVVDDAFHIIINYSIHNNKMH